MEYPSHSHKPCKQLTWQVLIYSKWLGDISLKPKQTKLPALLELMFYLKK